MPCYHPLDAWRDASGISFVSTSDGRFCRLPCGRCVGCRLERSRQWALRLVDEARFYDRSSFITLTFDDDHLPSPPSLDVQDFQKFMKRLRKEVQPLKIRFFHVGEYGEKRGRPHYHAIIFGHDFREDLFDEHRTPRGDLLWSSKLLSKVWPFGMNMVGAVTFESCAYVARYVMKKVNGPQAESHYEYVDENGECHDLKPEYATMSRRPGIGFRHVEKYVGSIYSFDECVSRGVACKPPRFYDKCLEKFDEALYSQIKDDRECALDLSSRSDRTRKRLAVRETVKLAQIGTLSRSLK